MASLRWTPQTVTALLRDRGFRPRRSLGQNFLVDENFLDALVRDAEIGPEDGVVEIGSGLGSLTDRLAARAGRVWAFEIDPRLHALSAELLAGRPNVALLNVDGAEFAGYVDAKLPLKVVSNLPYADWQRLLLRMLSTPLTVVSYTLMIQRDAYDRLRARPGTKSYGPLPALLQAACDLRLVRRAPRTLFYPRPRVDSVVIGLRRRDATLDFEATEARLRDLFAHRRKKSAAAGGRRVETLAPAELLALCRPTVPGKFT